MLAGAALATLGVPAAADAQYYGRSSGTYGNHRHYYWDGHHYRDRNNNAIIDALIAGVLGYAVGTATSRSYGYSYPYSSYGYSSYPSYGYGYSSYPSYGYSSYGYSYPSYGYSYQYSTPRYRYCSYYRC